MLSLASQADAATFYESSFETKNINAVDENSSASRLEIIRLLNETLASVHVSTLRYRRHYFLARLVNIEHITRIFLQYFNEEQVFANRLAARIAQLNGEPRTMPNLLMRSEPSHTVAPQSLQDMIAENLVAERTIISCHRELIHQLEKVDFVSAELGSEMLRNAETHVCGLVNLLNCFSAPVGDSDNRIAKKEYSAQSMPA